MALWAASPLTHPATVLLTLVLAAALAVYAYATRNFSYWRRKGVPFLPPVPFVGNLKDSVLFRRHIGNVLYDVYRNMKGQRFVGMYFFDQPVLLVKDIELWKLVLHKDFDHFSARGFAPSDNIFGQNLFSLQGPRWKNLRAQLSPAFTVGKLKKFYLLIERKAANLGNYFNDAVRDGTPCDAANACARYTMDAIASVGFGIDTRCLTDDEDPLYRLLCSIFVYSKFYTLVSLATFVDVPLLRLLGTSLVPAPLTAFLRRTIWEVVREREARGLQGARGDFLDLLLELRDKGRIAADDKDADAAEQTPGTGERIDMDGDMLISQVFSVFSAGFDTTTTAMSYALYHLAKDQAMQEKLRTHLQETLQKHDGKLTYEALQSVEYLDMVFAESLRMYPVLPFLDRKCTKDYRIPGTDIVLNKGAFAFASTLGIHRDPLLYPEPERFDPERFSEENKHQIPSGAYFPFGDGQHKCIGMRLGTLQGKVGIAHIILNYRLQPCATTPDKIEFNNNSFLIHPRGGIPLKFCRV